MGRLSMFCIGFLLGIPAIFKGAVLTGFTPGEASVIVYVAFVAAAALSIIVEDTTFGFGHVWTIAFIAAVFTGFVTAFSAFAAVIAAFVVTVTIFAIAANAARREGVSLGKVFSLFGIEGVGIFLALSATSWWVVLMAVSAGSLLSLGLGRWRGPL